MGRPGRGKLFKARSHNSAKQGWAVASTLLSAPTLVTPPHKIKQLEAQTGMHKNPPEQDAVSATQCSLIEEG